MNEQMRQQVWQRAAGICEYCQMPQATDVLPFQIDHIIAIKHHGFTILENLCLSCLNCNLAKSSNIAGIDQETNELTPLFNPRRQDWHEHFEWEGPRLKGKTPIGRTTVDVLNINLPDRVEHRRLLSEAGLF